MPIGATTPQADGSVASLPTMRANVNLVESYLQGDIPSTDFQDKIRLIHGRKGSVHRVYGTHHDSNVEPNVRPSVENITTAVWPLDRDAILDFTHYGDVGGDLYNGGLKEYVIGAQSAFNRFTWEKMGNIPTRNSNGTGGKIETDIWSFRNWIYNAPDPKEVLGDALNNFIDGRVYAQRFPTDEYWDRWLTVPYASQRIYVPGQCVLYVIGNATGTWNHNLNPFFEYDTDSVGAGGTNWKPHSGGGYTQDTECPAFFRLFVDKDNDKEWRKFSWSTGGETFHANWSPVQEYPEVGYSTDSISTMEGREWSFTCAPRAKALVASQIVIPEAGWYNISMKYNSRYWNGQTAFTGQVAGVDQYDWVGSFLKKAGTVGYRPGFISQARWESCGIGAIAVLNRTSVADNATHSDF